MNSTCWVRFIDLEFGPFELPELATLVKEHRVPGEMEFRVDGTELWWSWPSIALENAENGHHEYGLLGNWFVRTDETHISGPFTVLQVTEDLLTGKLSSAIEVQIGDGAWRRISELLVLIPEPAPLSEEEVGEAALPVEVPVEKTEEEIEQETIRSDLEAWFAQTLPEKEITVKESVRKPTGTVDDIVAAAMKRVALAADETAKELSRPWIWGGFMAASVITLIALIWQPRGPDELEVRALRTLKNVVAEIQTVRSTQPSEEDWEAYSKEVTEQVLSLKAELAKSQRPSAPAKELLYWAIEYRLPVILQEGRLAAPAAEGHFNEHLRQAERLMGPTNR